MPFDFNYAPEQRDIELIPADTVVPVVIKVRGDSADGLKRSKDGRSSGVDMELTVTDGEFAKRKLWTWLTRAGETDGHKQAIEISAQTIRAILESARGVKPDDKGLEAAKARQIENYIDLDGMQFWALIGIEPAKNGYDAKNKLIRVITPDRKEWRKLEQPPPRPASPIGTAVPTKTSKPAWANKGKS
jgi:hypothetical protein